MIRKALLALIFVTCALPAWARAEDRNYLDVALTVGINGPGGGVGLHGAWRKWNWVALAGDIGGGLWGPRVSGQVRLQPLPMRWGPYAALGLGASPGTPEVTVSVKDIDGNRVNARFQLQRLSTLYLLAGLRTEFFVFLSDFFIGYAAPLGGGDIVQLTSYPLGREALRGVEARRPWGFIIGVNLGLSF